MVQMYYFCLKNANISTNTTSTSLTSMSPDMSIIPSDLPPSKNTKNKMLKKLNLTTPDGSNDDTNDLLTDDNIEHLPKDKSPKEHISLKPKTKKAKKNHSVNLVQRRQ